MLHQLKQLVVNPSALLIDASGVLYSDLGPFPGAAEALAYFQQKNVPIFIATNNSYSSPDLISKRFKNYGMAIAPEQILSSGMGLANDPEIRDLLSGKIVFVFGKKESYPYVDRAPIQRRTSQIKEAEVIVMTSSNSDTHEKDFIELQAYLDHHPDTPIICCNPDRFVVNNGAYIKVIGYYAEIIEKIYPNPFYWFGKPEGNYAKMIKKYLETYANIPVTPQIYFFDDNIKNVKNMVETIPVSGVLVSETGLSFELTETELSKNHVTNMYFIRKFFL